MILQSAQDLGGDVKEGYLRLDDGSMPRLEAKWHTATGYTSVRDVVTRYLDELKKKAEKQKRSIKVKRDTRLLSRRRKRKASLECFSWSGEEQAHGVAWYCDRCSRVVIAQAIGEAGENLRPLAAEGADVPVGGHAHAQLLPSDTDHLLVRWSR